MHNDPEKCLVSARFASPLESVLVATTLFCLPLFEAPKNILSVLFLFAWIAQAMRSKSLGSNCLFNKPLFGLVIILWVAPLFSDYGATITPLNSAPRWTLLALFVIAAARLDFSERQTLLILSAMLLGGVLAVVDSLWVWQLNGRAYPEFRSVGHVNHSAMYTLVTLACGLGALYIRKSSIKVMAVSAIISTVVFIGLSKSLVAGASSVVILFAMLVCVSVVQRWSTGGLLVAILVSIFFVMLILMTPPAEGFRIELMARIAGNDFFSGRDKLLNSALAVWDRHPIFGTGWFSFGIAVSEVEVRFALVERGIEYDPNTYFHGPHGHNLWVTMLIERGLVGVTLVTILLFLYFKAFAPIALSRDRVDLTARGASVGALLIVVGFFVAGLGNTTMMNEHGHAGMAFIAVVYGHLRGRGYLTRAERSVQLKDLNLERNL